MQCYICDGPLGDPRLDARDMKIKHCGSCEQVINELLFEADEELEFNYIETQLGDFEEELAHGSEADLVD